MSVTDEETERFLNLVKPECRSYAIKALSNTHTPFVYIEIGIGYCDGYIKVIRDDMVSFIELNPVFAPFKKDDAEFIASYISRRFDNLKLIFSSSITSVFSSITSVFSKNISGMSVVIGRRFYDDALTASLFSHNKFAICLDLSENNSDFSNEIWNVVLSSRSNVNRMMLAYVSGKYYASDNIKKRIQALYESLSDSDKLLLELGEDLTNI